MLDRDDPRQFGFSGLFTRFAEPLTRRSEPGEQAAAIDETDVQIAEAHDMVCSFEFGNANKFIDQSFTDEDKLAFPFDFTVAAHAPNLMIGVVPGILEMIRHGAWRGDIEIDRWNLAKGFMRTLMIVVLAKGIEAGLLLYAVVACCEQVCAFGRWLSRIQPSPAARPGGQSAVRCRV